MEPKIAERRLKILKAFLLVTGISLAVSTVSMVLHGVLSAINEIEEPASFYIALMGLYVFINSNSIGYSQI